VGARPGNEEAGSGNRLDQPRHRLEGELEPFLVHEPADQQHELLVRLGELGPKAPQSLVVVK
jgi:hypothetical protein